MPASQVPLDGHWALMALGVDVDRHGPWSTSARQVPGSSNSSTSGTEHVKRRDHDLQQAGVADQSSYQDPIIPRPKPQDPRKVSIEVLPVMLWEQLYTSHIGGTNNRRGNAPHYEACQLSTTSQSPARAGPDEKTHKKAG